MSEIDPGNLDQQRAWEGETGEYWVAHAQRINDGIARYQGPFLDAAAIAPTARVLDVGCGSGQTTRDAARRASAGSVLGVDISERMLALARQLTAREGITNAAFQQADVQVHPFTEQAFDVAISRYGSMFFAHPVAAFRNIGAALRPGGRLVLLTWQPFERNEWIRTFFAVLNPTMPPPPPHTPGPFGLSDPDRIRAVLTEGGFTDVHVRGLAEKMYFGPDPGDAARFVAGQFNWLVRDLDAAARDRALDALRANLAEHQTADGVHYDSAAWLVEAVKA